MLFNSFAYLLAFLPAAVALYFALGRAGHDRAARAALLGASLVFYGCWDLRFVPLLLASIGFNFALSRRLARGGRRELLAFGIAANLALLGFFKYTGFALETLGRVLGTSTPALGIVLPLAISFFTFQQIAWLVDCHRGRARDRSLLDYGLFVCFFPQLVAGPIVHHAEMMPQFAARARRVLDAENVRRGLVLLSIGLAKKVVVADTLALWANAGFEAPAGLGLLPAWAATLAYTFQLYFDFSGYTDMALGAALLFNIELPLNFDAPYKSGSIREFWRRWHMTLSRWLRDYLYVPLGGSRRGRGRTLANLFVTFLLGGLWHGAGWTFVAWGALHGAACAVQRVWEEAGLRLPRGAGRVLTFGFVCLAWVPFRAETLLGAGQMFAALGGANGLGAVNPLCWPAIAFAAAIAFGAPTSVELSRTRWLAHPLGAATAGALGWAALTVLEIRHASEFLYFQF